MRKHLEIPISPNSVPQNITPIHLSKFQNFLFYTYLTNYCVFRMNSLLKGGVYVNS